VKLQGRYVLPGSPEQVWSLLTDPTRLAKSLPGCERLEPDGPDRYRAAISFALAAISGKYSGSLELSEKKPPHSLQIRIRGKGVPGFLDGKGQLELVPLKGQTEVRYEGEAQVGGMVAAVGGRMIESAAKKIVQQFFEKAAALLKESAGSAEKG
jgi:carbon monoxide dehydrogenase subunit G